MVDDSQASDINANDSEENLESVEHANEQDGAENSDSNQAVESLSKEVAETKDKYIRLMAEFENYKKRTLKEQSELLRYQGERVVVDLLEVGDNLELAIAHSSSDPEKLKTGLEMVLKLFTERLAKWDIKAESAIGLNFDPQKHSAISRVPAGDKTPGTVVGELKRAYFYKDKLIRHGEVVVATES